MVPAVAVRCPKVGAAVAVVSGVRAVVASGLRVAVGV